MVFNQECIYQEYATATEMRLGIGYLHATSQQCVQTVKTTNKVAKPLYHNVRVSARALHREQTAYDQWLMVVFTVYTSTIAVT